MTALGWDDDDDEAEDPPVVELPFGDLRVDEPEDVRMDPRTDPDPCFPKM